MSYKIIFEYNRLFDKIVMKIIGNGKIIFYKTVTDRVFNVAEEYSKEMKKLQNRAGEMSESFLKM